MTKNVIGKFLEIITIQGITKSVISRLVRRGGGVKRISGLIYEKTRAVVGYEGVRCECIKGIL